VCRRAERVRRPGDVQQAVAQALGLKPGAVGVQDMNSQPSQQVLGEPDQFQPCLVGREGVEGQAREAELAGLSDPVLDACVQPVADLQADDVDAVLVGEGKQW
jgi:hypothetical protein